MAEQKKSRNKLTLKAITDTTFFDQMLEGVQIIDNKFRYVYANDSLIKQCKIPRKELIGYTMMEKYPGIEKTELFKLLIKCKRYKHFFVIPNEFVFPDKTIKWFELSIQPIANGILILSIDITDRKKAEETLREAESNYRELFNKSNDGILVYETEDFSVFEVNQQASVISGFSREELKKKGLNIFEPADPNESAVKIIRRIKETAKGKTYTFECKTVDQNHHINWFEVNLKNATIAGKNRVLAFFQNINSRKKAQEDLLLLNETLEDRINERTHQLMTVNKELESFSYSVSHDLRAPLRALYGYSKIIEEDYSHILDSEAKRLLSNIQYYIQKMGNLIDYLLEFSKMGRKEVEKVKINMRDIVDETISELSISQPNNAHITVHALIDTYADYTLIKQVWINLLSNAIKYSGKKDSPKIVIGSRRRKNEICYFITDNGDGFDMKYAYRLFGVFQRLHAPEDFEGTGIGLAIIQRIITKHEGKVWVKAKRGEGATFYFTLPDNIGKIPNN